MSGKRSPQRVLTTPTRAGLALAALLLLAACYARQPIASDPPAEPVGTPVAAQQAPRPAAAADAAKEPAAQAAQQNATAEAAPVQKAVVQEYYVQTGAFTTQKNAEGAVAWLKERGYAEARIVRVEQGQSTYLRVQAGPFQGYAPARKALDELKKDWPQAFIPGD